MAFPREVARAPLLAEVKICDEIEDMAEETEETVVVEGGRGWQVWLAG